MKKAVEGIGTLISLFLVGPIWYYLLYKILQFVHATELMWFLFWIYIPAALFAGVLVAVAKALAKD